MAGVGFELRRMIENRRGVIAKVRAYSCAGLISSGPWLMTILTLTLLNLAGPYLGGTEGYSLFRALVTYAFAFSLILQGFAQMAVTRRVADLLYTKQYDAVLPAFVATMVGVGLVHAAIGTAFCVWADFSAVLSFLAVTLFVIIGMTWIALIWLTVVRQYDEVLRAYVYGTLVAMVGVVLLFLSRGTVGVLAAYTAGQAFTLVLLLRTIMRGMNASGGRDLSVFRSLASFPMLVGVGLFYNAAIWVDKMIFWYQDGIGPHSLVRYHPLYDTCSFLAYLTVVPALAVNLVRLETAFYERYRAYYGAILGGTPLGVIEDKRRRMLHNLEESMVRLLKTQGAITAVAILFAPVICDTLELPPISIRLFRLTCLGAFFHVLLLINILMQMYFDLRKQALATSLVFFALNGLLAWWSVNRGVETYGIGYALASFMSLLLGYLLLYRSLDQLDYMTFTSQPIGSDEERREATVLAEQERAAEEAATAAKPEEEEEQPATPAPIVVAAGEMAPPEAVDEVSVDEVVLEEQEAVPEPQSVVPAAPFEAAPGAASETATDLPEFRPAGPPREVEPASDTPLETATDLPRPPKPVPAAEAAPDAPAETATDLPGEPRLGPPAPVAPDLSRRSPEGAEADATATDLPAEAKLTPPAPVAPDLSRRSPEGAEADATATEPEPTPAAPLETSTDVAGEPGIPRPTGAEADLSRRSPDLSAVARSAKAEGAEADSTATEIDPDAFDAVVDEIEDELEFVGFGPRAPQVDSGATETDLGSYPDALPPEAETEAEATATDVGELSELEAAVADLAAQVEADPLHGETDTDAEADLSAEARSAEEDATATDVGNLSTLKKAMDTLADEVDTGQLDEEAEDQADGESEAEPEDEPEDITHSQLDIVRPQSGQRPAAEPSDETEAD